MKYIVLTGAEKSPVVIVPYPSSSQDEPLTAMDRGTAIEALSDAEEIIGFDLKQGRMHVMALKPPLYSDILIRASFLNSHFTDYSLSAIGLRLIGRPAPANPLNGSIPYGQTSSEDVRQFRVLAQYYADIYKAQAKAIEENGALALDWVESRLIPVLMRMEEFGIRVDTKSAKDMQEHLEDGVQEVEADLSDFSTTVNWSSPKQLIEYFKPFKQNGQWYIEDGVLCDTTPTGAPSISKHTLAAMRRPEGKLITILRERKLLLNTFVQGHILREQKEGRVYAHFHQSKSADGQGTRTGRFSITRPALQQIHKRDAEVARIMRSLFLPEEGQQWLSLDYSQMEYRVLAHFTKEPKLVSAYRENPDTDFHQAVAKLTGLNRKTAKSVNLGLGFGMGAEKTIKIIMENTTDESLTEAQAREMYEGYHAKFPNLRRFLRQAAAEAESKGYVTTILGRRLYLEKEESYKAGSFIFQGSAADAIKLKMIVCEKLARFLGGRLLLSVHDELDFSFPLGVDYTPLVEAYTDFSSPPIQFDIPIKAEVGVGENWWEACK